MHAGAGIWAHGKSPQAACSMQVTLNMGLEFVSLEPAMSELKFTPEALEVPVPSFLVRRSTQVCPAAYTYALNAAGHSMAHYSSC